LGDDAGDLVSYLRGDRSEEQSEGGDYRNRTTLLGDIVHSQPVYVGKVSPNVFAGRSFTGSDAEATFASKHSSRTGSEYVAANDGMVHGFNADTGVETFAYLPAAVMPHGIAKLAMPDYGKRGNQHQYFNDGQLTVADAYFNQSWHTVLVGTTGRGAARA